WGAAPLVEPLLRCALERFDDKHRAVLRRLSVLADFWYLRMAQEICAFDGVTELDVLDSVVFLGNTGLVDGASDGGPLRLPECVRRYAAQSLAADLAESETAHRRHRDLLVRVY